MDAILDWCKEVETTLLRLDSIPPLGNAPEFPWDTCAENFSKAFDNVECKITPQEWSWLEENKLLEGFPEETRVIEIAAAPLKSPIYWALEIASLDELTSRLLSGKEGVRQIPLPQLKESFTTFIVLNALHTIRSFPSLQGLSPNLVHPMVTPKGRCIARDIRVECGGVVQNCRLLLSESASNEIKEHFRATKSPLSLKSSEIADTIEVLLNVEIGQTSLSKQELDSIEPGDFLRLDSCTMDPKSGEGTCSIYVEGSPLFQAKLTPSGLEVT